jgi:hypothetical protein
MSDVLQKCEDGSMVMFWCPGCETYHGVWLRGFEHHNPNNAGWDWNGSMERPTFSPSILVRGFRSITDAEHAAIMSGVHVEPVPTVCHSFVRDGRIEFLGDCTHKLASRTVDMEPEE